MGHLGVNANIANPILVNYGNQATITYTKDPTYHDKTKHINLKYNFVKDMVAFKEVNMKYISLHKMVVDPLMKPIP